MYRTVPVSLIHNYRRGGDRLVDNIYWDISRSLSYNTLFNFVVGSRGTGKTYGFKMYAIRKFLEDGSQFVYLRRRASELKGIKNYFNDIKDEFPDNELMVKGDTFLIDGEIAGWSIPLSTSYKLKSTAYPKVDKICYDEFIAPGSGGHKGSLKDEVVLFLELYETIARMRDNVRVWFLSNATTITNPYFRYFGMYVPVNSDFKRFKDDILLEVFINDAFVEAKESTRFGKLIKDTEYGEYSIRNEFFRDNNTFVAKMPSKCVQDFVIMWRGVKYGVFRHPNTSMMYFSNKFNPTDSRLLSFTTEDHQENTFLMQSNGFHVRVIRKLFEHNMVRFESINLKNELMPLIERIM